MRIVILCAFLLVQQSASGANTHDDSTSVYQYALSQIQGNKKNLYRYGSFQPRDLQEAFFIFLTGDSVVLAKFSNLGINEAIPFALNKENGIFRYDWGQEGFFLFSRYCIYHYRIFSPEILNKFALHSFHAWMNGDKLNQDKLAKKLIRKQQSLNRYWRKKYKHTSKYLNKAYDNIWKADKKNRKAEKRYIDSKLED